MHAVASTPTNTSLVEILFGPAGLLLAAMNLKEGHEHDTHAISFASPVAYHASLLEIK
jgi:hypothetical protein